MPSYLYIGILVLGVVLFVVGITTFLWVPLLVIGLVGLVAAPLWALVVADADEYREGAPEQ